MTGFHTEEFSTERQQRYDTVFPLIIAAEESAADFSAAVDWLQQNQESLLD